MLVLGAVAGEGALEQRDGLGLRGQGKGEKRQGLFRNVHAATQSDVRAEGLRVEGDVAGGKLFADALG